MTYTYDGDGKRVKKSNGTLYWGAGPLAESDLTATATSWKEYVFFDGKRAARRDASNSGVHYFFPDHLGSASVTTNSTGATLEEDLDYYTYGGVASGSSSDHYLFTDKERDTESGLDYFGARYYGSSMGRFMWPDPKPASSHLENPQTWNRYTYTLNNPLIMIDPDGMEPITITVYTWIPYKSTWMFGTYGGGPKSVSRFTIETNSAVSKNPISSPVHEDVQPTVKYNSDGSTESKSASPSATATGTRVGDVSLVEYKQSDTNPLSPVPDVLTPAIKVDMTLAIPTNGSAILGTVTTSDYPAMQVTATYQNGNTQLLYSQMPAANTTLLLAVSGTTPISSSRSENICGVSASCQTVPRLPQPH